MGIGGSRIQNLSVVDVLERILKENAIMEEFYQWIHSSDSISIFVAGKTGSGKSTLVNALIGEDVAKEGELDPVTAEVTEHRSQRDGVTLKVWDSPGLQDGTNQEERYIADMKSKCKDVDLYLLCINISDVLRLNRDNPEIKAMRKLSNAFGSQMWENTVILLTFANEIEDNIQSIKAVKGKISRLKNRLSYMDKHGNSGTEEFKGVSKSLAEEESKLADLFTQNISEWDRKLRDLLINDVKVDPTQVKNLKIVPTGFRDCNSLPDRPHWLSTFWFSGLTSTKTKAQPALMHLNRSRIVKSAEELTEKDMEKHIDDQFLIFTERGKEFGGEIGATNQGMLVGLEIAQMEGFRLIERMLLERFLQLFQSQLPPEDEETAEDKEKKEQPTLEKSQCGGPSR